MGMFGWDRNNRIVVVLVLKIRIAVVYPKINMLFRNNENSYFSAIP
jgi:hypothetical protein